MTEQYGPVHEPRLAIHGLSRAEYSDLWPEVETSVQLLVLRVAGYYGPDRWDLERYLVGTNGTVLRYDACSRHYVQCRIDMLTQDTARGMAARAQPGRG